MTGRGRRLAGTKRLQSRVEALWREFRRLCRLFRGCIGLVADHSRVEFWGSDVQIDPDIAQVLLAYPADCQPTAVMSLTSAGGFSGATLWRLVTRRGGLVLRRWPSSHPSRSRLEFIQAVLWHVWHEGFQLIPLPVETQTHAGYVEHAGHFWEIVPWMPGSADYKSAPSRDKLAVALVALAQFHVAASSFPLPSTSLAVSPCALERRAKLDELSRKDLARLKAAITPRDWPELAPIAEKVLGQFDEARKRVEPLLTRAATIHVSQQPCIRDIWHEHVFFEADRVTGIIDFGSMRPENVAADIARLLGSMVGDDPNGWTFGIDAYQSVRRLSDDELFLVKAFDRSAVLLSPIQWLEWIYIDKRQFADRQRVMSRLHELTPRLLNLAAVH